MKFIDTIKRLKRDTSAAGGVVGFYMMVLIVVIIGLAVLIPVVTEQVAVVDGVPASATLTITGNVTCGQYVNLTFPDSTWVRYQANFTAGAAGCVLDTGAIAWPLTAAPEGNTSTNATTALETALNDDDDGNISGRLVLANPSAGVLTITYYQDGTEGNSMSGSESLALGTLTDFSGGVDSVSTVAETVLNLLTLMIALGIFMLIMRPLM